MSCDTEYVKTYQLNIPLTKYQVYVITELFNQFGRENIDHSFHVFIRNRIEAAAIKHNITVA